MFNVKFSITKNNNNLVFKIFQTVVIMVLDSFKVDNFV